ncbi:hypothetical protein G5B35_21440 [Parapusillimonas sp. SGNA-6]|nr:hypothetical protein [Parapusillimonas sp. SGNA-6]
MILKIEAFFSKRLSLYLRHFFIAQNLFENATIFSQRIVDLTGQVIVITVPAVVVGISTGIVTKTLIRASFDGIFAF